MDIEMGILLSGATVIASVAVAYATVKFTGEANRRDTAILFSELKETNIKMDSHGEAIVELKTKQGAAITAKEVHEQYISRELFEMHKAHIDHRFDQTDSRFDRVDNNMGKILAELQNLKSVR
ncbi:hypothetical protein [Sulfuricurvum sp.]|uniref:hypothetical protein n=1 Tax=Sulfuricurvum sp. TaxID=2025608 RepID=UPI00261735D3|nr:hypothetical protein [Sulfuricurvum sp.]MDD2267649.1 hypothetical protein [Sulfuricurvum sp.]MDD2784765.1 hypothetical protein [Sulfuricurvum sp.]